MTTITANSTTTGVKFSIARAAETSIPSKKRKITDGDCDDVLRWTKEAASGNSSLTAVLGNATNSFVASSNAESSRIQFLTVHFNILRALYRDNSQTDNDDDHLDSTKWTLPPPPSTNAGVEDAPMVNTANIWYHIQSFMMYQRESLLQIQQRIEHTSDLHQAALEYCDSPTTAVTTNSTIAMSKSIIEEKGNQTDQNHFKSSNHIVSSNSSQKPTNHSFRIIANIIGQQSKIIRQQKQVPSIGVLQKLLQEVARRIASLQAIYTKQCQGQGSISAKSFQINDHKVQDNEDSTAEQKRSPTVCCERSYRMELQYKMHLWSLLAYDLKEVLRN
jgi:hypothetical protein